MNTILSAKENDPISQLPESGKLVIGQLGQSLDGRIATHTGHSQYINNPCGLTHLHRLRASVHAVVIGVGTANADDPQLTVRHCEGKSPARVVIDPNGRLFATCQMLHDNGPPVLVVTARDIDHPAGDRAEIIALPRDGGKLSPQAILTALEERGMERVLVEGGSRTLSSFINAKCIDRLHLIVAPLLLGSGYPGLNFSAIATVDEALKPDVTAYLLGSDILYDCVFRNRDAPAAQKDPRDRQTLRLNRCR